MGPSLDDGGLQAWIPGALLAKYANLPCLLRKFSFTVRREQTTRKHLLYINAMKSAVGSRQMIQQGSAIYGTQQFTDITVPLISLGKLIFKISSKICFEVFI